MVDLMKYVRELAEGIGPRPASTEEENHAAILIGKRFREHGINPVVQEFASPMGASWPYIACYIATAFAALISGLDSRAAIVATILAVIAFVLFTLERNGRGVLSSLRNEGISQNVIGCHVPKGAGRERRKRRVVIIAHYDSAKADPHAAPFFVNLYPYARIGIRAIMIALPLMCLVQVLPLPLSAKVLNVFWYVSMGFGALLFVPVLGILVRKLFMHYIDGANDNASGVAAMLGVLHKVLPLEGDDEADEEPASAVVHHGEEEAYAAGVVPEGAELEYRIDEGGQSAFELGDTSAIRRDFVSGRADGLTDEIPAVSGQGAAYTGLTDHDDEWDARPSDPAAALPTSRPVGRVSTTVGSPRARRVTELAAAAANVEATAATFAAAESALAAREAAAAIEAAGAVAETSTAAAGATASFSSLSARDKSNRPAPSPVEDEIDSKLQEHKDDAARSRFADVPTRSYRRSRMPKPSSTPEPESVTGPETKTVQSEPGDTSGLDVMSDSVVAQPAVSTAGSTASFSAVDIAEAMAATKEYASTSEGALDIEGSAFSFGAGFDAPSIPARVSVSEPVSSLPETRPYVPGAYSDLSQEAPSFEDIEAFELPIPSISSEHSTRPQISEESIPSFGESDHDYDAFAIPRATREVSDSFIDSDIENGIDGSSTADEYGFGSEFESERHGGFLNGLFSRKKKVRAHEYDEDTLEDSGDAFENAFSVSTEFPGFDEGTSAGKASAFDDSQRLFSLPDIELSSGTLEVREDLKRDVEGQTVGGRRAGATRKFSPTPRQRTSSFAPVSSGASLFGDPTEFDPFEYREESGGQRRQAAGVESEYHATPQANPDFAGSTSLPSFDAASSLDRGATGSFERAGSTGDFDLGDIYRQTPSSYSAKNTQFDADLSGSFSRISGNESFIEEGFDNDFGMNDYGNEYSIIPESRFHRVADSLGDLFSGKRKKKKVQAQEKVSDWLGVEDFDARKAGRDIGSWKNFSDETNDVDEDEFGWKGGGTIGGRSSDTASEREGVSDQRIPSDASRFGTGSLSGRSTGISRATSGGSGSRRRMDSRKVAAEIREAVVSMSDRDLLDKEVWFVALGASEVGNVGMKAFLSEYGNELTNSLIINLDNVGSGELCYITEEGGGRKYNSDRRLQSLARKLSKDLGHEMPAGVMKWRSTDATVALSRGYRAMTIMGLDGFAPMDWHWRSDVSENINPDNLQNTVRVVTEIIRNA